MSCGTPGCPKSTTCSTVSTDNQALAESWRRVAERDSELKFARQVLGNLAASVHRTLTQSPADAHQHALRNAQQAAWTLLEQCADLDPTTNRWIFHDPT